MDRFVNSILAECPGVPGIIIKGKVLRAAISFCNDSWVWVKKITTPVPFEATTITLVIPEKTVVAGITAAIVDDRPFPYYTREGAVLTLDSAAKEDFSLVMTVALKPSLGATELNDTLCDDWYEGIESKAKELLMIMPGKPWYNPELASAYNRRFNEEVVLAKIRASQKNNTAQNGVYMRPFI